MNVAFGGLLTLLTIVAAPAISAFYQGAGTSLRSLASLRSAFIITGAGVQQSVLLHRRMQFGVAATIEIVAL